MKTRPQRTVRARWLALALVVSIPAAFALGRETRPSENSPGGTHEYTIHQGDAIHVPDAATWCVASVEGGAPNLFCERSPQGRYEVVFYEDSVLVWGPGGPDDVAATYDWRP